MTSNRPYLLRAIYDWITDNGLTPYILVDAEQPGVQVPPQTIRDGQVVLNIAMRAVANLDLGDDRVAFSARFSGASRQVSLPLPAIQAIYAQENGQGMMFPEEEVPPSSDAQETPLQDVGGEGDAAAGDDDGDKPKRGAPHLRVVK
ncbi:ClpXP protease specificity-enhancing factor [Oleiagrimonas sp. C23AA]|uniref:ClpXP protease specificity-enhancing factor n=1 Tax=Oleiagrimonas sp. C23AA TaxID=2719047 RepID=UPI001421DC5C|nr:ClpXP protease specificity-enhancing factor [Oleiagrimonas sp. C23AA]NII11472.1 ClpXP protease specificity-enhancing factor [Oleiagrimonas sp. C23AA]